jgi:hypothetical protein
LQYSQQAMLVLLLPAMTAAHQSFIFLPSTTSSAL